MEDIKKLLEQNDYLLSSSDENESDDDSLPILNLQENKDCFSLSSPNSIGPKKRNGENRLPTRRPDPNVYNRNALLARENRRKKKMYLETIEKELQITRKANRVLTKALKRQLKVTQRLEQEKKYYEGLIANRSEILTLVNALNFRRIPESEPDKSPFSSTSNNGLSRDAPSSSSLSCSFNDVDSLSMQFDTLSDGSVAAPLDNSLSDISSFDFSTFPDYFTDIENGADCNLASTSTKWDDIWGENGYQIDNLITTQTSTAHYKSGIHNINNDHCYVASTTFNSIETPDQKSDTSDYIDIEGDCRHNDIIHSTTNWNPAQTPPLQLLSDYSTS